MATWDGGEQEMACARCGAVHLVAYKDYPARDRGKELCRACGEVLIEWSSTRDYTVLRLLTKSR